MSAATDCRLDRRKAEVRAKGWNGIEGVNVSPDQLSLTVFLLANAPRDLRAHDFVIEGGQRVTDIAVTGIEFCEDDDPELADRVRLTVDKRGDRSRYRLCLVGRNGEDDPGPGCHPEFDPRYACVEFSFAQNCPDLLDCAPGEDCPPPAYTTPEIDYLAKDYASFRRLLLERLSLTMPDWTDRHTPDVGIALVELLAAAGDRLSYRQDATATEAYLDTARLRVSIRRHARLVDYLMHDGCAARAWVCVEVAEEIELPAGDFRFATLPPGVPAAHGSAVLSSDLADLDPDTFEVFEPVPAEDLTLYPAHNTMRFWTWGDLDCCLPRGSTAATLRDDSDPATPPTLKAGDVVILRETVGARTGLPGDADTTHCQAVRLTSVTRSSDELYDQPLLEVTWAREDALTFDLCITAHGGPDCEPLEVGVVHGNVVLVEHGRSLTWCGGAPESHQRPPAGQGDPGCPECPGFGCSCDDRAVRGAPYPPENRPFTVRLEHGPVTQSAPYPSASQQARAQADDLRGLPGRTRRRLHQLRRKVEGGEPLSTKDARYLTTVFGAKRLDILGLDRRPEWAIASLIAGFDDFLDSKLSRLSEIVRRARAGYVLDADDEAWEIGQSWGASERLRLDPQRTVFRGPATSATRPDPRGALPSVALTVDGDHDSVWQPRRDLLESRPTDRHFVGESDDEGRMTVRFGSAPGASPPPGSTIEAAYRVGNGAVGNVGRNVINRIVFCSTRTSAVQRVWNPLPATGGQDPEPVTEVRQKAPNEMTQGLARAITAADYARLADQVPGVARAAGDLRWTGGWYEAQVAVDPDGAAVAPDWLLDAVRDALHPYRRVGHDLAVSSARLVPLDVALRIEIEPDHVTGHVRAALERVLGSRQLSDGSLGFFHPDRLTFGEPIRASQLVATAARVPGVRQVEITRLHPLFGLPGPALLDGVHRIGELEVARLDNDPANPENGILTLDLRGGR